MFHNHILYHCCEKQIRGRRKMMGFPPPSISDINYWTHWSLRDFVEISKINLLNGIFRSSHDNALRLILRGLIDNKQTLAQVMDWCRQTTSDYLNSMSTKVINDFNVICRFRNMLALYCGHRQVSMMVGDGLVSIQHQWSLLLTWIDSNPSIYN